MKVYCKTIGSRGFLLDNSLVGWTQYLNWAYVLDFLILFVIQSNGLHPLGPVEVCMFFTSPYRGHLSKSWAGSLRIFLVIISIGWAILLDLLQHVRF